MKIKINKLKSIKNFITVENYIIFAITGTIALSMLKNFTFYINVDNLNLHLSIIVASIACAAFFVNYQKSFIIDNKNKIKIKFLVDLLISSSLALVFIVLIINSGIDFYILNRIIAWLLGILVILCISSFTFCVVKLWWFIIKNIKLK